MNFVKMLLLFTVTLGGYASLSLGSEQLEVPKEDSEFKYYLGIAESTPTYRDGLNQAFEQAVSEAIRENFGFKVSISADTYLTEASTKSLKRFRQNSQNVDLKGFERVDMKVKTIDEKYTVQMLYRYSKKAIAIELAKLNSSDQLQTPASETEIGSNTKDNLGGIEVFTEPSHASIYIDDQPFLKSPIKVSNQVVPGTHVLVIDHPAYETIKEDIIVIPGENVKIKKLLEPAYGVLNIESDPDGADVFLNNKHLGKTPYRSLSLPAATKFNLRLEHPKALLQSFEGLTVDKNVTRTDSFSLRLKSGRLELFVEPRPDSITLDGQSVSLDQRIIEKPAGTYQLKIVKDGYEHFSEFVNFEPNGIATKKIMISKTEIQPAPATPMLTDEYYLQFKGLMISSSSFIKTSPRGTTGFQAEISLGHTDYIGFFAFGGGQVSLAEPQSRTLGDLAEISRYGAGVWLYSFRPGFGPGALQLGLFNDNMKAAQYVSTSGFSELTPSTTPLAYNGVGVVLSYTTLVEHSMTVDLKFGGETIKPVIKSNVELENMFFFSIGLGLDLADLIRRFK